MATKEQARRNNRATAMQQLPQPDICETSAPRAAPAIAVQLAESAGSSLAAHEVVQLQHAIGNCAASQLLAGTIRRRQAPDRSVAGSVGDGGEREADDTQLEEYVPEQYENYI